VTIPAITIPWWNSEKQLLARETLPAVTFNVQPPENVAPAPAAISTEAYWGRDLWIVVVALAGVCVLVVSKLRPQIVKVLRRRREVYLNGERGRFARLCSACRANDPVASYNMLTQWLDSRHRGPEPSTLAADLLSSSSNSTLQREVESLEDALLDRTVPWHGRKLLSQLRIGRRSQGTKRSETSAAELLASQPGEADQARTGNRMLHRAGL
jgi:hypothetical protein